MATDLDVSGAESTELGIASDLDSQTIPGTRQTCLIV